VLPPTRALREFKKSLRMITSSALSIVKTSKKWYDSQTWWGYTDESSPNTCETVAAPNTQSSAQPPAKRRKAEEPPSATTPTTSQQPRNISQLALYELPMALKLQVLREIDLKELASLELALNCRLSQQSNTALNDNTPWNKVVSLTRCNNLPQELKIVPSSIALNDLQSMPDILIKRAMTNIKAALTLMLAKLPTVMFQPSAEHLLIEWRYDGLRYSKGAARLEAENWLTDEAAHYLRNIVFAFKIPITRLPTIWNSVVL
jgi:hypothetical protein